MSFRPQGEIPNTVSYKQRSEGFLIPLRSIRNDITDLGCQNPLGGYQCHISFLMYSTAYHCLRLSQAFDGQSALPLSY
jgi:hypothetical protein